MLVRTYGHLRVRYAGQTGGDGMPPPAKRHAPVSAIDRVAEELAAFRRQQMEAAMLLGYDPDGPPAMKASPATSESEGEERILGGRRGWARGSASVEAGEVDAGGRERKGIQHEREETAVKQRFRRAGVDLQEEEEELGEPPKG